MRRLLGFLVFLLGFAAAAAEAKERWPKARHCDPLSWFCAGPNGLESRGPAPFFGVPSYARPDRGWRSHAGRHRGWSPDARHDRGWTVPPTVRPRHYVPTRPDVSDPPRPRRHTGPVICDPGRGVCYRPQPEPSARPRGFVWRGLDDGPHRLYRPDRRSPPPVRFRPEWR